MKEGSTLLSVSFVLFSRSFVLAIFGTFLVTSCTISSAANNIDPEQTGDTFYPLTQGSWWVYKHTRMTGRRAQTHYRQRKVLAPNDNEYPKELPVYARKKNVVVVQDSYCDEGKASKVPPQFVRDREQLENYEYYTVEDGLVKQLSEVAPGNTVVHVVVPLEPKESQNWLSEYGPCNSNMPNPNILNATYEYADSPELSLKRYRDSGLLEFEKGKGLVSHTEGTLRELNTKLVDFHIEKGKAPHPTK